MGIAMRGGYPGAKEHYRALSLSLSDEQKKEADRLTREWIRVYKN
jgi:hypothetical protein